MTNPIKKYQNLTVAASRPPLAPLLGLAASSECVGLRASASLVRFLATMMNLLTCKSFFSLSLSSTETFFFKREVEK